MVPKYVPNWILSRTFWLIWSKPRGNWDHNWSLDILDLLSIWDRSHRSFFLAIGTTRHKSSYGQYHYKCISLFGISPNFTFLQRPGIDPIGHFSLPSGPLDTKVHMDCPITNSFRYLGSVPTVHFIKAWDWSHRSFFFAIGTTQHKSL